MQRLAAITAWRRNFLHNRLKYIFNTLTCLGTAENCLRGVKSNSLLNLLFDAVGIGRGQINLVDDRHYFKIVVKGEVDVGESLCLNAL